MTTAGASAPAQVYHVHYITNRRIRTTPNVLRSSYVESSSYSQECYATDSDYFPPRTNRQIRALDFHFVYHFTANRLAGYKNVTNPFPSVKLMIPSPGHVPNPHMVATGVATLAWAAITHILVTLKRGLVRGAMQYYLVPHWNNFRRRINAIEILEGEQHTWIEWECNSRASSGLRGGQWYRTMSRTWPNDFRGATPLLLRTTLAQTLRGHGP